MLTTGEISAHLAEVYGESVSKEPISYGIFDETNNERWGSVGETSDTAEFAGNSIRSCWATMGRARFPDATKLMITADAGDRADTGFGPGKRHLARLTAHTGPEITVCHYPPDTSKWNRIEHRMFSFICMNCEAGPLTRVTSYRTIIELIAAPTAKTGLRIRAELHTEFYPTGITITTPNSPPCPSPPTNGTATGTTPSPRQRANDQSCGAL